MRVDKTGFLFSEMNLNDRFGDTSSIFYHFLSSQFYSNNSLSKECRINEDKKSYFPVASERCFICLIYFISRSETFSISIYKSAGLF